MTNDIGSTKIVVENVAGRGLYVKVYNKYGKFFMGSPLSIKMSNEPSAAIYTDEKDFEVRHAKWVEKCQSKLKTYLHQTFNSSLYGNLEINFEGFNYEK